MNEIDPLLAVEFLQRNAKAFSDAKGERIFIENYLKTVKSRLMQQSKSKSLGDREADAYAHADYVEQLNGLREAVKAEELLKLLITAASAKLEVWKVDSFNKRQELKSLM